VKSIKRGARIGGAAVALGLSLTGPQAVGVAAADSGSEESAATSPGQSPTRADTSASPRQSAGVRSGASTTGFRAAPEDPDPPRVGADSGRPTGAHEPPTVTAEVAARAAAGPVVPLARASAQTAPARPALLEPPPAASIPFLGKGPAVSDVLTAASAAPVDAAPVVMAVTWAPTADHATHLDAPAHEPSPLIRPRRSPRKPVDAALRAVSNLLGVVSGALAGHDPTAPVDALWGWTMLAAASRETFAPAGTAETAWTSSTTSTPVTAIPQTPLLTALGLQKIPIIGPLVVTPIVAVINAIPVVSDLLHPLVGYPLLPDGLAEPRDVRVVSFDGTQINVHLMPAVGLPAGAEAPTVLLGSPLFTPGGTNLNGTPLDGLLTDFGGEVGIATLRTAGYNVVTWDPRGAYFSGGLMQMNSPEYEARDVSAIISWVAEQPETQLDSPGDPRMGMVGASYGGGIQLVSAATDHRVDAIVPTIAWNTLNSSIYPNDAYRTGNGILLAAALVFTLTRVNPRFFPAIIHGGLTGELTPADQDLLAQRGPGPALGFPDLVSQISAPTLLIQGTVDTELSLKQADMTAISLLAHGVPTKVIWFCGGHGLCINNLFDPSEGALIEQRTLAWLNRYVKGEAVSTGPGFEWVDQRGQHLSTETYGVSSGEPIVASRSTGDVLPLVPFLGGSGPMLLVLPIGGTKALNAVNLDTPDTTTTTYIVGEPQLTLGYSGTGIGDHVYAQLVDNTSGQVLGNQVTPIPVTLDGQTHTISLPLQPVAHTLRPGETVTLQLFAWSADYAASPSWGALKVTDIRISLPTNAVDTVEVSREVEFVPHVHDARFHPRHQAHPGLDRHEPDQQTGLFRATACRPHGAKPRSLHPTLPVRGGWAPEQQR